VRCALVIRKCLMMLGDIKQKFGTSAINKKKLNSTKFHKHISCLLVSLLPTNRTYPLQHVASIFSSHLQGVLIYKAWIYIYFVHPYCLKMATSNSRNVLKQSPASGKGQFVGNKTYLYPLHGRCIPSALVMSV
jgi:sulfur relay (sulfurtransferase) DsrC/TusE family protein